MAIRILPQEFHFAETRNDCSVRTTVPRDKIEGGDLLIPHIRRLNLGAGTHVQVQVLEPGYDVLLHEANFIVIRSEARQQTVPDGAGDERTVMVVDYRLALQGEWWNSPEAKAKAFVTDGETVMVAAEAGLASESEEPADGGTEEQRPRRGRPPKSEAA